MAWWIWAFLGLILLGVEITTPGGFYILFFGLVDTKLAAVGQASITFAHVLRDRTSGRLVVEGSAKLVTVDDSLKVTRLDKLTLAALQGPPQTRS